MITAKRDRPGGDSGAAQVLRSGTNGSDCTARAGNRPRLQFVIEVNIVGFGAQEARAAVTFATERVAPGTHVRLKVGDGVPTWILTSMRGDLTWQIVASDATTVLRWTEYLGGAS